MARTDGQQRQRPWAPEGAKKKAVCATCIKYPAGECTSDDCNCKTISHDCDNAGDDVLCCHICIRVTSEIVMLRGPGLGTCLLNQNDVLRMLGLFLGLFWAKIPKSKWIRFEDTHPLSQLVVLCRKILVSLFDQFEKHHFGSADMCWPGHTKWQYRETENRDRRETRGSQWEYNQQNLNLTIWNLFMSSRAGRRSSPRVSLSLCLLLSVWPAPIAGKWHKAPVISGVMMFCPDPAFGARAGDTEGDSQCLGAGALRGILSCSQKTGTEREINPGNCVCICVRYKICGNVTEESGKDETVAMCSPRNCNNVQMATPRISQVDHC